MRRIMIFLAALALSVPEAGAASVACPPHISVAPQSLAQEMPGWYAYFDAQRTQYTLNATTVYWGEPGAMSLLAPTASDASYTDYALYNNGQEKYYVMCGYANTSVQLYRLLDYGFKQCRVTYQRVSLSGATLPYGIDCE